MYYERLMQVTGLTKQAGMEKAALSGWRIFNTLMRGIGTPTKNGKINYKAINGILARIKGRTEASLDNTLRGATPTAAQAANAKTAKDVIQRLIKAKGDDLAPANKILGGNPKVADDALRAHALWGMYRPDFPVRRGFSSHYFPGESGSSYQSYLFDQRLSGSPQSRARWEMLTGGDAGLEKTINAGNQAYNSTLAKLPNG